ncbi:hypothetical protein HYS94_05700 [Candidatus Daviesbacteria bacterium]|nr:hypothetical protein [Candidatus Daviesbacteria bacterium]
MTDLGLVETEAIKIPESSLITRFKNAAQEIGRNTADLLSKTRDFSSRFLDRLWYSHSTTLWLMEAATSSALSLNPQLHTLGTTAGLAFLGGAIVTTAENIYRKRVNKIEVGEHMVVEIGRYKALRETKLAEGTVLKPGQKIGLIHFIRNLPILGREDSVISFGKNLYHQAEASLKDLALRCQNNDPALAGVEFFYGSSHLANLAKGLGFDVFEEANPFKRWLNTKKGKDLAERIAKNNIHWQKYRDNYKAARVAVISREKLIQLYGSEST